MHRLGSPLPCLHVAEDLVIGAVFLDDVDAIFDRAGVANLAGNRVPFRSLEYDTLIGLEWIAGVSLFAEFTHRLRGRLFDHAECSAIQSGNVLRDGFRPRRQRIGALRIRQRFYPLAVGDVEAFIGRVEAHRGRIPADRDETQHAFGLAALRDIKNGHVVGTRVGDEEQFTVGGEAQAVGRVPNWGGWIQRTGNRL